MSKASMTTGNIQFGTRSAQGKYGDKGEVEENKRSESDPMHIAIVANFSGDKSRGELARRQVLEVDRDNFEEVFEKLSPCLDLPIFEQPIIFNEFDDLHPDYLVERAGVFDELQALKRRLAKPALFEQAARDIQSILDIEPEKEILEKTPVAIEQKSGDFMESILANSQKNGSMLQNPLSDINAFVRSIVSPYVEPVTDPRLEDMLQAVDTATGNLLRKIMHASQFQEIEAAWRSLYLLVRSIETNSKLKIFIVDVLREELLKDLTEGGELSQSQMYKLLVKKRQTSGQTPFSVINIDSYVSNDLASARMAEAFASIAKSSGGIALLGATSRIAGCQSFADSEDSDDWTLELEPEFITNWKALRECSASQHLGLVAPRYMVRLPYGASTSPIDSFKFEELNSELNHDYYLWGNGTFLVTCLIAQSYTQRGWDFSHGPVTNKIDGLPLHIYQLDGESVIKPCAELMLRDRGADKLASLGVISIRSVSNSDSILISNFRSVSVNGEAIFACLSTI